MRTVGVEASFIEFVNVKGRAYLIGFNDKLQP